MRCSKVILQKKNTQFKGYLNGTRMPACNVRKIILKNWLGNIERKLINAED